MPSRVVAFLLAAIVLWSGFSTHERTFSLALAGPVGEASQRVPPRPAQGSIDHHHLDDLPAQTQAESSADLPPLPAWRAQAPSCPLAMTRPGAGPHAGVPDPCLPRPQRPPRPA